MFVYILECSDGSYYTGVTNSIWIRFDQHQRGMHPESYTYSRRPVKLVYFQTFNSPLPAIAYEKKIKKWSHAKKKALIEGKYYLLPALSKKDFGKKKKKRQFE